MSPSSPPLRAAATVRQRDDGSFHLRLVVQNDGLTGERELVARSCQDLVGVAAVNLALMIEDPGPLSAASPSPAEATAQRAGPSQPVPVQLAAAPVSRRPISAAEPNVVRALIQGPRLSFALGPMPSPSLGFSLAGGVMLGPWHIVAGGTVWLPHSSESTRPDTSATLARLQADTHFCRAFELGRLGLAPCVSLSVEHLRAQGTGPYVRTATAATTWLAGGAGLQARYPLTRWLNVLCSADLKLQTARPRVSIEGVGRLAELGWVAMELSLGSEWIL